MITRILMGSSSETKKGEKREGGGEKVGGVLWATKYEKERRARRIDCHFTIL